jgi:hypothetical protein
MIDPRVSDFDQKHIQAALDAFKVRRMSLAAHMDSLTSHGLSEMFGNDIKEYQSEMDCLDTLFTQFLYTYTQRQFSSKELHKE